MGKKYIIELSEDCVDGGYLSIPARIAGTFQWFKTELNLTPYTEPDLDAIRKEAYEEGRKVGIKDGMCEAWEVARKVVGLETVNRRKVFGTEYMYSILENNTATEAIEKIRQYEQEKEEQIQVGDEVELKCGVSPAIYMQGTNGSDEIYLLFNDGSCGIHVRDEIKCKTGRHFPEIAEVLQKMKES